MSRPSQRSDSRTFTPPRAIVRVLRVIEVLADRSGPMSLAELSVALAIPKTSLFAILKGLTQADYVAFENDAYTLGARSRKLASAVAGSTQPFPACALPVLRQLSQATGETVILGVLSEDRRHVVYEIVVETDSWLRFSVKAGTRRPLSAAASGHAILSCLPADERERYIGSEPFERFTPKTVATPAALRKAIARARRDHCAVSTDGTVTAATGIAAPYFSQGGEVRGAVLIAAPSERVAGRQEEIMASAKAGAEAISRLLRYEGPYPP